MYTLVLQIELNLHRSLPKQGINFKTHGNKTFAIKSDFCKC